MDRPQPTPEPDALATPQASEQQLLAQARRGDRAALGALLEAYHGRLYGVCLRMVSNPDDAAELAQDAMVKIVESIDRFRGEAHLSTWMIRIAMNLSISHLRKRKLRRAASLEAGPDNGEPDGDGPTMRLGLADDREPTPDRRVEQGEMLGYLKAAIAGLDDDFRAVLVLRDIEQMDYRQIADVLEVNIGTVKSRLFRARLALRRRMSQYDPMNQQTRAGARRSEVSDD